MKKAGIFAAVIAVVLLFMQLYNYKIVAYMDDSCYVVNDAQIAKNLLDGPENKDDADKKLKQYEVSDPVYKRGKNLYIGQDRYKMDLAYPLYVNEGGTLLNMSGQSVLITSDFTELPCYQGLYLADGMSFNVDRIQADPDEILFQKLGNGLFMNVQDMEITSMTGTSVIGANSLMNPEEGIIRYYSFRKGNLTYGEDQDLLGATVRIGSVSMRYTELLDRLKPPVKTGGAGGKDLKPEEMVHIEESTDGTSGVALSGWIKSLFVKEDKTAAAGKNSSGTGKTENGAAQQEAAGSSANGSGTKDQAAQAEGSLPERDHSLADANNPFDGDRSMGSSGKRDKDTSGGGHSNSSGGVDGGTDGGTDAGGSDEFIMPTASLSPFTMGVYDAKAKLTITDPASRIRKGVRLVFYRKGDSRPYIRKSFKASGDITVEPLPPDTYFEVEGYFEYFNASGGRSEYYFMPKQLIKTPTLGIDQLEDLEVVQHFDDNTLSPKKIQIRDFQIVNAVERKVYPEGTDPASPGDASYEMLPASEAAKYIATVNMNIAQNTRATYDSKLDSLLLGSLKKADTVKWQTADMLESDTKYHYIINIMDRFGNRLNTTEPVVDGMAFTSKEAPVASLAVDNKSTVGKQIIKIEITNKDLAKFMKEGDGKTDQCYLQVEYAAEPGISIPFKLSGEKEERYRVPVSASGASEVVISSLLSNTSYKLIVTGSYDLQDKVSHIDVFMGSALVTSDKLSSLGTVSFELLNSDITATSAVITSSIVGRKVNSNLYPFLSQLKITVSDYEDGNKVYYETVLNRDQLDDDDLGVEGDAPYIIATSVDTGQKPGFSPNISVSLPVAASRVNPWFALFHDGSLKIEFPDGQMKPGTRYRVELRAIASQAGSSTDRVVTEDVTGRYYSTNFRTLRQPARVKYEASFVTSSYAIFYKLHVDDPNGSVVGGAVSAKLKLKSNGRVVTVRNYTTSQLAEMESVTFDGLEKGQTYILEFVAAEYNEGYSLNTRVTYKTLESEKVLMFKAEDTLSGKLDLASMDRDYESQDGKAVGMSSINLFDYNDVTVGYTTSSAKGDLVPNSYYSASDYIAVNPRQPYIFMGSMYTYVYMYDKDKNFLGMPAWSGNVPTVNLVPENAAYMRITVRNTSLSNAVLGEAVNAEADSDANLLKKYSSYIAEGKFISHPDSGGEGTVIENKNCYYTEKLIPVQGGKRYVRLNMDSYGNTSETVAGSSGTTYFYDQNGKVVDKYKGNPWYSTIDIPQGVAYVRLNGNLAGREDAFFGVLSDSMNGSNLCTASVKWTGERWVEPAGRLEKKASQYCISDYIPVKGSAQYYKESSGQGMGVYDGNFRFLGFIAGDSLITRIPDHGAYVRLNGMTGDSAKTMVFKQVTPKLQIDDLNVKIDVSLEDKNGELTAEPNYTLIYEQADTLNPQEEDYQVVKEEKLPAGEAVGGILKNRVAFGTESGRSYRISLKVIFQGRELALDTLKFNTGSAARIIKKGPGLLAISSAPMDSYVVVNDIESKLSPVDNLYGSLDFQGHTLIRTDNMGSIVTYIRSGGMIENVVVNAGCKSYVNASGWTGLVTQNYGTIKNVIVNLSFDNPAVNTYVGGIVSYNRPGAVLENFAVNLKSDFVTGTYSGAVAQNNEGTIRNGYVVGNGYKMTTYSGDTGGFGRRGGLVGANKGTLKNVYAVLDSEIVGGTTAGNEENGLVAGYATTSVNNVFSVGSLLVNSLPSPKTGPAVGFVGSATTCNNVAYTELMTYSGSYYNNTINNKVSRNLLGEQAWVNSIINGDGQFLVSMVSGGYYPQVVLPESMNGKQPMVDLPVTQIPSRPTISSVEVVEQKEDEATVKFRFKNPQKLEIKSINLAKADPGGDGFRIYADHAAQVAIVQQQDEADGSYAVTAKITDPAYFRSIYYVYEYVAGVKGNDNTNFVCSEDNREKTAVPIEFYRNVTSLKDWESYMANKILDLRGNYRIRADYIDFANVTYTNYLNTYRVTREFCGVIDGSWTDSSGKRHMATIANINDLGSQFNFFSTFKGTLRNLNIDGLRINTSYAGGTNVGFIGKLDSGLVDNVHIKNADITVGNLGGALVGDTRFGVIQNCSVTDSYLHSYDTAVSTIILGGLAGRASNSTSIYRCFTYNLKLEAKKAFQLSGVGGIVGIADNSVIDGCYTVGEIHSNYPKVGGIMGASSIAVNVTNCWSKMDIDTYSGYAGGIIGYGVGTDTGKNNLALGDVFTHNTNTSDIHRIVGYSSSPFPQNGAYANQLVGSAIDPSDKDDAEFLFTKADLENPASYTEKMQMDYDAYDWKGELKAQTEIKEDIGVQNGYLPLLKNLNGSLIPGQTPVKISQHDMTLTATLEQNENAVKEFKDMFGQNETTPFSEAYELRFEAAIGDYQLVSAAVDGLNLNERLMDQDTFKEEITTVDGVTYLKRRYPFVGADRGSDRYRLILTVKSKEDPTQEVKVSAAIDFRIFYQISNAKEWNQIMKLYGADYGNYKITGNIDGSTLTNGEELITGVKVNSLIGVNDQAAISNVSRSALTKNDSLIAESLSEISNLEFKNISWTRDSQMKTAYSNIGVIGTNQGIIDHVKFTDITLDLGSAEYLGCVGNDMGNISDVTLKNIKITSDGGYVGGLAGISVKGVRGVEAYGTMSQEDKNGRIEYSSTYQIQGGTRVGGIVGQGDVIDSRAEGLRVAGIQYYGTPAQPQYFGGMSGVGTVGIDASSVDEGEQIRSYIDKCVVELPDDMTALNIGGATGLGSGFYVTSSDVTVRAKSGDNVAGVSASHSGNHAVKRSRVENCRIIGRDFVGGAAAQRSAQHTDVIKCEITGRSSVGGLAGYQSNATNVSNSVDQCQVTAETRHAGGLLGWSESSKLEASKVSRTVVKGNSYVGGLAGRFTSRTGYILNCGVTGVTVKADRNRDAADGESYAGGAVGSIEIITTCQFNIVDSTTTVDASGSFVGGFAGKGAGGWYNGCYSAAQVNMGQPLIDESDRRYGSCVGGLFGQFDSYQKSGSVDGAKDYRRGKIYDCYAAGNLKAADYGAGLIGQYLVSDKDGMPITPAYYYGLVTLANVYKGGSAAGTDYFHPCFNGENGNVPGTAGAVRVFDKSMVKDQDAAAFYSSGSVSVKYWDQVKPLAAGGTASGNVSADTGGTLLVTSENLMDSRLYKNTAANGGLGWAAAGWNFKGLGLMENPALNRPAAGIGIDVTVNGVPVTQDPDTLLYTVDAGLPEVTVKNTDAGNAYTWYRSTTADYKNGVAVTGAVTEKEKLAGRGYYFCTVKKAGGTTVQTPIIAVRTPGYMPYVAFYGNYNVYKEVEGQEGIDPACVSFETRYYDCSDDWYYGGVEIPSVSSIIRMSMLDLNAELPSVRVYPSGIDTVNVEFGPDSQGSGYFLAAVGKKTLYEDYITQRVYSFRYDYKSPFTVTVGANGAYQTTTYEPAMLRRTVMAWGEDYYYTGSDVVMNGDGKVLEGDFIHLYDGQVLADDGTVYDLSSARKIRTAKEPGLMADGGAPAAVPLYEASYDGCDIKTFEGFSEIIGPGALDLVEMEASDPADEGAEAVNSSGQQGTVTRELKLLVKDGTLYAIDTENCISGGFAADSYNGDTFLTLLGKDGAMKDRAAAIKKPAEISRYNIAHMSNNMNTDEPWILLRYTSGSVMGFNYITGERLNVDNAFSDISMIDYVGNFLRGSLLNMTTGSDQAYLDLKKLQEKLTVRPLQESDLLDGADTDGEIKGGDKSGEKTLDGIDSAGESPAGPGGVNGQVGPENQNSAAWNQDIQNHGDGGDQDGNADTKVTGKERAGEERLSVNLQQSENENGIEGSGTAGSDAAQKVNAGNEQMADAATDTAGPDVNPKKGTSDKTGKAEGRGPLSGTDNALEIRQYPDEADQKSGALEGDSDAVSEAEGKSEGSKVPGEQKIEASSKRTRYVVVYNDAKEKYDLYKAEDMLFLPQDQLRTEQDKMDDLEAKGIVVNENAAMRRRSKSGSKGKTVVYLTSAIAVILAGFIVRRKKQY